MFVKGMHVIFIGGLFIFIRFITIFLKAQNVSELRGIIGYYTVDKPNHIANDGWRYGPYLCNKIQNEF